MHVGWPLYKRFGHAFEGFKQMVANADEILKTLVKEVKETDAETGKEVRPSVLISPHPSGAPFLVQSPSFCELYGWTDFRTNSSKPLYWSLK